MTLAMEHLTERRMTVPGGGSVQLFTREETSDHSVAISVLEEDEYRLAKLPPLSGVALDVGAHIGTVTLALLARHPDLRVVAVEPLAANVDLLMRNLELNDWVARVTVFEAAIGTDRVRWDYAGEGWNRTNRYIGNLGLLEPSAEQVAEVGQFGSIREEYVFEKWDCERCEWSPDFGLAQLGPLADYVAGEWHGDPGIPELERIFAETHDLETTDAGAAGLFWAVRR